MKLVSLENRSLAIFKGHKMSREETSQDFLFDIKNAFFTGNFQQCIKEAQKLKVGRDIAAFADRENLPFIKAYQFNLLPNTILFVLPA